ncbi:hypothetical protein ACFL2Q_16235, partial [Thermodesulfobacteriota bacterium]
MASHKPLSVYLLYKNDLNHISGSIGTEPEEGRIYPLLKLENLGASESLKAGWALLAWNSKPDPTGPVNADKINQFLRGILRTIGFRREASHAKDWGVFKHDAGSVDENNNPGGWVKDEDAVTGDWEIYYLSDTAAPVSDSNLPFQLTDYLTEIPKMGNINPLFPDRPSVSLFIPPKDLGINTANDPFIPVNGGTPCLMEAFTYEAGEEFRFSFGTKAPATVAPGFKVGLKNRITEVKGLGVYLDGLNLPTYDIEHTGGFAGELKIASESVAPATAR